VARPYRFVLWGLVAALVVGLGALALHGPAGAKLDAINAYYGQLLHRTEFSAVHGPHYWQDGKIVWAGQSHLETSSDLGATVAGDIALPDTFTGNARSLSEFILADKSNVYLRQGDGFKRVLENFKCWYVCGSRLNTGDFIIGEYGSRIYRLDATTGQTQLLLENPPETRHFHFTAVDPLTGDIYTSLGDADKFEVTGIMRSQDGGKTWQWLDKAVGGSQENHNQPTAVYFDTDAIYFGKDNRPEGILRLDRKTGRLDRVFTMSKLFRSWFTGIAKVNGSFWAISRSFTHKPKPSFGLLWWSQDGRSWVPVQVFGDAPIWLAADPDRDVISIGFLRPETNVVAFTLPDAAQMEAWVRHGPRVGALDWLFGRDLKGPFERLTGQARSGKR
jgi:hypothetical protein